MIVNHSPNYEMIPMILQNKNCTERNRVVITLVTTSAGVAADGGSREQISEAPDACGLIMVSP